MKVKLVESIDNDDVFELLKSNGFTIRERHPNWGDNRDKKIIYDVSYEFDDLSGVEIEDIYDSDDPGVEYSIPGYEDDLIDMLYDIFEMDENDNPYFMHNGKKYTVDIEESDIDIEPDLHLNKYDVPEGTIKAIWSFSLEE